MECLDEETVVAFVNGALRGPALAAVERHLVDCPACATLVAVAAPPSRTGGQSGSPAPELTVGRYRLLAAWSAAAAWARSTPRTIPSSIARSPSRSCGPTPTPTTIEAARLAREAQAVARLSHPNVVAIYDVGSSGGRMFLAMELVEGETLAVWLAHHTRPIERDPLDVLAWRGAASAPRIAPESSTATSSRRT